MKTTFLILLILVFLSGCGSVSAGFKLNIGYTGDEFLFYKKNPLVLPPEFSEFSQTKSTNILKANDEDSFNTKIINKNSLN